MTGRPEGPGQTEHLTLDPSGLGQAVGTDEGDAHERLVRSRRRSVPTR